MAAGRRREHRVWDDLGQIEAVGLERLGPLGLGELGPPGGDLADEALPHLVDAATGLLALLGAQ